MGEEKERKKKNTVIYVLNLFIRSLTYRSSKDSKPPLNIVKSKGKPDNTELWNALEASFFFILIFIAHIITISIKRTIKITNVPTWISIERLVPVSSKIALTLTLKKRQIHGETSNTK